MHETPQFLSSSVVSLLPYPGTAKSVLFHFECWPTSTIWFWSRNPDITSGWIVLGSSTSSKSLLSLSILFISTTEPLFVQLEQLATFDCCRKSYCVADKMVNLHFLFNGAQIHVCSLLLPQNFSCYYYYYRHRFLLVWLSRWLGFTN